MEYTATVGCECSHSGAPAQFMQHTQRPTGESNIQHKTCNMQRPTGKQHTTCNAIPPSHTCHLWAGQWTHLERSGSHGCAFGGAAQGRAGHMHHATHHVQHSMQCCSAEAACGLSSAHMERMRVHARHGLEQVCDRVLSEVCRHVPFQNTYVIAAYRFKPSAPQFAPNRYAVHSVDLVRLTFAVRARAAERIRSLAHPLALGPPALGRRRACTRRSRCRC